MVLLPALVLASCTTTLPGRGSVSPGDYVGHLDSREEDLSPRSYLIHVTRRRDDALPPPVVPVLHGALSTARGIEDRSGFSPLAETTTLYGGRVVRSVCHGEGDTAPVVLYEIRDWPHVWPGPDATATLAPDDQLRGFDTARVVWEDLRSHSRK